MLPNWLAGLPEFFELDQANKAIPRYNDQSNFRAVTATHVSHTPRGPQLELQPTPHSVPPRNALGSKCDTDLSEPSPPGLVLGGSQCKGELV